MAQINKCAGPLLVNVSMPSSLTNLVLNVGERIRMI
jgi:hypothetical protein